MQHDFIHCLRCIDRVPFTPIIADGVGKNVTGVVERRRRDGAPDLRVALEAVLGVLVPEMEGAVTAGGAESAVHGMEGNGVYRVDVGYVPGCGWRLTVAFEGEIGTGLERRMGVSGLICGGGKVNVRETLVGRKRVIYLLSFSSTY